MHVYKAKRHGTRFLFNNDLSGLVEVHTDSGSHPLGVPGDDLVDFVMEHFVKARIISWLEDADLSRLTGLLRLWKP